MVRIRMRDSCEQVSLLTPDPLLHICCWCCCRYSCNAVAHMRVEKWDNKWISVCIATDAIIGFLSSSKNMQMWIGLHILVCDVTVAFDNSWPNIQKHADSCVDKILQVQQRFQSGPHPGRQRSLYVFMAELQLTLRNAQYQVCPTLCLAVQSEKLVLLPFTPISNKIDDGFIFKVQKNSVV